MIRISISLAAYQAITAERERDRDLVVFDQPLCEARVKVLFSKRFGGVVKVTGFTGAQGDTPARNRRSTRQGRATPLMRPSVSACKPAG
jgi:hypothetical protein